MLYEWKANNILLWLCLPVWIFLFFLFLYFVNTSSSMGTWNENLIWILVRKIFVLLNSENSLCSLMVIYFSYIFLGHFVNITKKSEHFSVLETFALDKWKHMYVTGTKMYAESLLEKYLQEMKSYWHFLCPLTSSRKFEIFFYFFFSPNSFFG